MNLRRTASIVLVTTVALLSTPVGASGSTETTVPTDSGAAATPGLSTLLPIPPPVDEEIAAVLENERRAAAVEDAKAGAAAEMAAANTIIEAAQAAVDSANEVVAREAGAVAEQQAGLDRARGAVERASETVNEKARQAITVGVAMYVETGGERDPRMSVAMAVLAGGRGIPDASAANVYRDTLADKAFGDLQGARKAADRARDRADRAKDRVAKAKEKLNRGVEAADKLRAELAEAYKQAAEAKSQGEKQIAAAMASAPSLKSTELTGGLAILGDPLVSAKDLAAFVRKRGKAHSSIDIEKLAETFIAEGRAEGVRSDVAWVQSIIETGWFSFGASMVRTDDYNYAGIGACDSCSRGIIFPSMSDGVRTQVQLLRTYATKGLTTRDLANPPPRLAPEKSSVRGCCRTWMGLSGVWATGPGYGIKILTLYNQLLAFAAQQRQT